MGSIAYTGPAKNILIRGIGLSGTSFLNAIRFEPAGGSLTMEDVAISTQSNGDGSGLQFAPGANASLTLRNVRFQRASAGNGAGHASRRNRKRAQIEEAIPR